MIASHNQTRIDAAKKALIKAGFCFIDHSAGKLQLIPSREIEIAEAILDKQHIPHHTSSETINKRDLELLVVEAPNTYM